MPAGRPGSAVGLKFGFGTGSVRWRSAKGERSVHQMQRTTCGAVFTLLLLSAGPAAAQGWFDGLFGGGEGRYERRGYERDYGRRGYREIDDWNSHDQRDQSRERSRRTEGGDIRDGGGRPSIVPQAPPIVAFNHDYPINS